MKMEVIVAIKKPKLTMASRNLLKAIADEQFNSDLGYKFVNEKVNVLIDLGYVVVDSAITDDSGNIAAQVTEDGARVLGIHPEQKKEINESEKKEMTETKTKTTYEIESDVPLTTVKRNNTGAVKYPFDKLDIGQSFHVPQTEDDPNPSKRMGSVVSSNKKRLGCVFTARTVDESDPKGPGCRVYRLS